MEMDMEWKWSGNGAQFAKIVWIGLDLGPSVDLKPYDRHRTFTKHDYERGRRPSEFSLNMRIFSS